MGLWHQPVLHKSAVSRAVKCHGSLGSRRAAIAGACSAGSRAGLCLNLMGRDGRGERRAWTHSGNVTAKPGAPAQVSGEACAHEPLLGAPSASPLALGEVAHLPVGIRAAALSLGSCLCRLLAPPEGAPASWGSRVYSGFGVTCLPPHACTHHSTGLCNTNQPRQPCSESQGHRQEAGPQGYGSDGRQSCTHTAFSVPRHQGELSFLKHPVIL